VLTSRVVTPAAPAGAFIDAQTLPTTGTYTVLVDPSAEATGSLTFSLYSVSPDTVDPITAGGASVTVTSSQPGQNNYLTFTGTLNQRISILVSNVTVESAKLNVLKPDGTPLLASPVVVSPAGAFLDVKVLPVAGNYKIFLDPQGASFGSADITLYTVPADLTGSILANGTTTTVTTTAPGQNAKLTFSGAAGQRVSLNLTSVSMGASACCSVKVSILKPDNTQLASKTVGTDGGFFDVTALPVAGTYKVSVDPLQAGFGSITLNLYTVPANTTGTLSAGVGATVTTTVPGQNATRTFTGTANQRFSFLASGVTMASVKVKVTRPDGLSLFQSTFDTDGGFVEPKTLPLTGTYTVTIDPQGASTGSITLTYYNVTADVTTSASVGGSGSVTIGSPGQKGKINFSGTNGQNLTFTVTSVSMTPLACCIDVVQFQVYLGTTPVGEATFSDATGAAGTNWSVPLTATGSYYILVDPIGESTGSASVSIAAS
jgi:large repetitive protein